jgi:hypothetical protein
VEAVDLGAGQRMRRAASRALDLQAAAEAGEIGGRAHMLGGHRAMLGMAERFVNMTKIAKPR